MTDDRDRRMPLIILAGGAREDEAVPGQVDRISGPKGARIKVDGRPLIEVVVEAFAECGSFDPIVIAGPAEYYGDSRGDAEVVDTDGEFAENAFKALEVVTARSKPRAVAFAACDLVPDVDELKQVMADYFAHEPLDFCYPVLRVPEQDSALGASAYKRQYSLIPEGETEEVSILPGHLLIVDPSAIRVTLIRQSFELAYRSRTQNVAQRFFYIIAGVLWLLLKEDLRAIASLRPPLYTAEVFWHAVPLAWGLAVGSITQGAIERRLRSLFASWSHRRAYPDRRGRVPILDALSLATDIDTKGEAEERSLEI